MRRWISSLFILLLCLGLVGATCPPSADQSTLTGGSSSVLTDNSGNGWGIPINGGNVFLQGTSLPATSKAVQLAYVGGLIWYQNSSLQWYSLTPSGAIASGPQSGSPLSQVETLTIANIPTQTAGTAFTVSGTIANATSVPTLQYSVNGQAYQALPTGKSPAPAPQTQSVTTGTWVVNQKLTFPGGPSAFGGMQYNYLLPANYDPVNHVYPLLMVGSGLDQGMNGSTYPRDGSVFISAIESDNFLFNTVAFRTAHPAIVVAVQCDQTLDLSGASFDSNCGGYNDSPNGSWNEKAISAVQQHFINDAGACGGTGSCSVDTTQLLWDGLSLSAIGFLAQAVDNNIVNNMGNKSVTAAIGNSTQLYRPATPNSAVFSRMRNVPYFSICKQGDNPCNYDEPFWQSITGNANYPTKAQYDAGGVAATQAGNTAFHLIGDTYSGAAYTVFGCMNADTSIASPGGCDGTNILAWLFQQRSGTPSSGGGTVTQTSFTFTVPGLTANTSNTISVRDAAHTTVVAFSNTFAVNGPGGTLSGTPMSPLPGGYLHTSGNQILDGGGNNVRVACSGYGSPTGNYNSDMSLMRNQGFNCARYDLVGSQVCPSVLSGTTYVPGTCNFSTLDQIVSAATNNNMKVVFDMHGSDSNCGGSQPNGLWYDLNSSTSVAGVTWNALKANGDGCSTTTGTGNFSVSGGFLHDPSGAKFVPEGVNIYDYNLAQVIQNSSGFPLANLFPGINYLRVMVCAGAECSQNGWNGATNGQPTSINYPNPSNYLQIAGWCQSAKIVCEFEDHTSNGSYWEFSNLQVGRSQSSSPIPGSSLMNSVNNFWAAMATQFKNNPYAWIGTFNELGIGGQAYTTAVFHQYSAYHQSLYNAIRATGNNNIIDLCGGNGCSDNGTMGPSALDASVYASMHNVMWLIHSYQDGTTANVAGIQANLAGTTQTGVYGPGCQGYLCQQQIQSADGVMPVIFNEFGMATGGSNTTNGQGIAQAMTNLQSLGIGSAGFVYYNPNCSNAQQTNSNCYGMVNNGGTAGLGIGTGSNQYNLINPWGGYIAAMIAANPFKGGTGTASAAAVQQQAGPLRNWYENPGMVDSFWVRPFPQNPAWITSGPIYTQTHGSGAYINTWGNFCPPWYIGKASDPLVTVTDGTRTIHVHVPLGAQREEPGDFSIGGADATQPYLVWTIQGANINTGTVAASGTVITGFNMAINDGSGLIMADAVTGEPGSNNTLGNIQDYELGRAAADPNYVIQHMLAYLLDINNVVSPTAPPVWPLKALDGSVTGHGTLRQGYTIGIPANIPRPAGRSRGFNLLWDNLQQYGWFFYNVGGTANRLVLPVCDVSGQYTALVNDIGANINEVFSHAAVLNDDPTVPGSQYSLETAKGYTPGATPAFPPPPNLDLSPTGGVNVSPSTFGAWYTSGYNATPTNPTNGGGPVPSGGPTKTYATFKADMAAIAAHYSGNATVIGFDLWNAPTITSTYQNPLVNWGNNDGADARLMCNDVGSAIETVNSGVLVICEGPINPGPTFLNGTAFQANFHNFADLSLALTQPVTLNVPNHIVYGVQDLPSFGQNPPWLDSGAPKITMMNTSWGGIVKQNTAPVWISAMGASLDGSDGFLSDEQAWASTLSTYMNGGAGSSGGPTFTGCQQPIGGDWLTFGNGSGTINGTLNANNTNKAGQYAVYSMLLYTTCSTNPGGPGPGGGTGGTTWNPNDKLGITLSTDLLTATSTGAHQGVRSTTSLSTGKVCAEANPTTISSNWTFGITNSSFPFNTGGGLGSEANGIGIDPNTGSGQGVFYNNQALAFGDGPSPNNEKITICVDLGAKLWWSTSATQRNAGHPWNSSSTANPATGTGGVSFAGLTCPCFLTFDTNESPSVAVLNAPGPFAVSIPSGFFAWQQPVALGSNHPILINLGN